MQQQRTFIVYTGSKNGRIQYIGTTVQKPSARFRWHRANGKRLEFKVVGTFDSADAMLAEELRLIKIHNPELNKITKRTQNLNVRLTDEQLALRRGADGWCQSCLRRRVNPGYTRCMRCG